MTTAPITYKIAFSSLKGINHALAHEILSRVPDETAFFEASERQLGSLMGFNNCIFSEEYRNQLLESARSETDFVLSRNIKTLYFTDPDYPTRLAECDDAPLMLYTIGDCNINECHTVGIVGTRHATPYGIDFTSRLVSQLSEMIEGKVVIVSGLAYGIDITAHKAALKTQTPTAGVLAHGLNTIYPAQHRNIAADIVREGGILLTDYPSSAPIHKGNFIARNRIVAGVCDCIVVVESAEKGGALITARLANDYNRDVFALPGRIGDKYSGGCNMLIKNHIASLITSAEDLIDVMHWKTKNDVSDQQSLFPELNDDEERVLNYLREHGEGQINRMTIDLNINIGKLTGILIELEFKNLAIAYPGAKYRPT